MSKATFKTLGGGSYIFDAKITTNAGTTGDVTLDIMAYSLPVAGGIGTPAGTGEGEDASFLQVVLVGAGKLFPPAADSAMYRFEIAPIN